MPYKNREKQLKAQKENYQNNKAIAAERQRLARQKTKDYINKIRENQKCKKCGDSHPAILDFHHRNPKEKEVQISKMIQDKWSPERIDKELIKCDILCSNCHRKLHWEEHNGV